MIIRLLFCGLVTALGVSLALLARKTARRESLLCETKKFEIMTDIEFAKAHMGEYFQLDGRGVRVIGYDATGDGDCIIVDVEEGRNIKYADSADVIMVPSRTGRFKYANWEELR